MTKRIKYTETIIKTHYIDVECDNEEVLNDFIHDNQKIYIKTEKDSPTKMRIKTSKYPEVNVKSLKRDVNVKSLGCTYVDEIDLRMTR